MEKVSIIVPMYQAEKTISRCIESVLKQTYSYWELILVNNNSTDKSEEIAKSIQDERIHIENQEIQGVSATRNKGIEAATGKYICFLDSDDYLSDNYLEVMINKMNEEKSDLVICNFQKVNGSEIQNNKNVEKDTIYNLYVANLLNPPWNKMFKKELIQENFRENMSLGEDLIFNIDYMKKAKKITYIDEFLYKYDITNETSLSKKEKNTPTSFLYLYQYLCDNLLNGKLDNQFQLFIVKHYIRFLYKTKKFNEIKNEYQYLRSFLEKNKASKIINNKILFYTLAFGYYKKNNRRRVEE